MGKRKQESQEMTVVTRPRAVSMQEEKYLHGILEGKTRRQAYADAYGYTIEGNMATAPTRLMGDLTKPRQMSLVCLSVKASVILRRPAVAERYKELLNLIATEPLLTLQQHMIALEALRNRSVQLGLLGSAIMAEIARGKAAGVHVEVHKIIDESKGKLPSTVDDFL